MRFVIVDAGQYAYENNKISPEYIDKLKGMYKIAIYLRAFSLI